MSPLKQSRNYLLSHVSGRASNKDATEFTTLARLLKFNLSTGAFSIIGNLSLMELLVGVAHLHYLVANMITISACSIVNFLVSDRWVFQEERNRRTGLISGRKCWRFYRWCDAAEGIVRLAGRLWLEPGRESTREL